MILILADGGTRISTAHIFDYTVSVLERVIQATFDAFPDCYIRDW